MSTTTELEVAEPDCEGLEDAARQAARAFQEYLGRHDGIGDRLAAMQLDHLGHLYRLAFYHLGGDTWRLAKQVDSEVSDGHPRAICMGADSDERITVVTRRGHVEQRRLGNYGGRLSTFASNPTAKHWPERWCPDCGYGRKTNKRKKAITRLKREAIAN